MSSAEGAWPYLAYMPRPVLRDGGRSCARSGARVFSSTSVMKWSADTPCACASLFSAAAIHRRCPIFRFMVLPLTVFYKHKETKGLLSR